MQAAKPLFDYPKYWAECFGPAPFLPMSREEMDRVVKNGAVELWRGLREHKGTSAEDFAESFRSGDYFASYGTYGSGIYFSENQRGAEDYAWDYVGVRGAVVRAALRADARVITHEDLALQIRGTNYRALDQGGISVNTAHWLTDNAGRYAASMGYDAIKIDGMNSYNVLNRTALFTEAESVSFR